RRRVGLGRCDQPPDRRRRREARRRAEAHPRLQGHLAGAPVAAAQHSRRRALRRLLRVGRGRPHVQQGRRHDAARQLGRDLRRHELLRQGRRLRQPDLHRRCGRLPEVDAAVNLLKKQRQAIGNYWGSYTSQISDFKNGSIVIGPTWPYQYNALVADKQNMGVVLPKEGATGWADTWMLSSHAKDPNCMLTWMAYATTPPVQAKTAYTFGSAPANPKACTILDKEVANYCTDYHVTDPNYFKSIAYWKTPLTDCGDDRGNTCVPYSEWTSAWTEIKNS